jgi:hypothetical protein
MLRKNDFISGLMLDRIFAEPSLVQPARQMLTGEQTALLLARFRRHSARSLRRRPKPWLDKNPRR